jgi:nitric oxide reductase activation protein
MMRARIILAGRSKQRPYAVLADIEALPSRLPTLYRRLTE